MAEISAILKDLKNAEMVVSFMFLIHKRLAPKKVWQILKGDHGLLTTQGSFSFNYSCCARYSWGYCSEQLNKRPVDCSLWVWLRRENNSAADPGYCGSSLSLGPYIQAKTRVTGIFGGKRCHVGFRANPSGRITLLTPMFLEIFVAEHYTPTET